MPSLKIQDSSGRWLPIPYVQGGSGSVSSVNGQSPDDSGDVTLTASDVGARADTWLPTTAEIGALAASQKGAAGGVAELDDNAHVPFDQLPKEVSNIHIVDNIAARDALTAFKNLYVYVKDATGDPNVGSGGACYIYDGTAWLRVPSSGGSGGSGGSSSVGWSDITGKPDIPNTFNGRSGVVVPQAGDYTAAMVGADAAGSSAAVQAALDGHKDDAARHISDEDRLGWNSKAAPSNSVEVALTAAGWTGEAAPYTQTVRVSGLNASGRKSNGTIGLSPSATAAMRNAARAAMISITGQADGVLTVSADGEKPTIDIASSVLIID